MSDYGSVITTAGAAAEAAANASGTPLQLTMFVVGDGGGNPVIPDAAQTELINEVYRGNISALSVNPDNETQLIATLVIPRESGGYVIRELGLLTEDGTLYSVSNFADQDKPAPDSGLAVSIKISYMLAVSNVADITFVLPADEYLTEAYADTLYLRQDKHLKEIADQGEEAQAEARKNLALGKLATKDELTASDVGAVPQYSTPLAVDLNTLGSHESAGVYFQQTDVDALPELNYPIAQSGTLLVTPSAYGCQQEYTTFSTGQKFVRGLTNDFDGVSGPWGPWRQYFGDSNAPPYPVTSVNGMQGAVNIPAPDLSPYATSEWVNNWFVQSIRLSGLSSRHFDPSVNVEDGAVFTNMDMVGGSSNVGNVYVRYIQQDINGVWAVIARL